MNALTTEVAGTLIGGLLLLLAATYWVDMVVHLIRGWTWLYTAAWPPALREDRRRENASFVHESLRAEQEIMAYSRNQAATRVLLTAQVAFLGITVLLLADILPDVVAYILGAANFTRNDVMFTLAAIALIIFVAPVTLCDLWIIFWALCRPAAATTLLAAESRFQRDLNAEQEYSSLSELAAWFVHCCIPAEARRWRLFWQVPALVRQAMREPTLGASADDQSKVT